MKAFVSIEDLAVAAGVKYQTAYYWVTRGKVKAVDLGEDGKVRGKDRYRVPASEVERVKRNLAAGIPVHVRDVDSISVG